MYRHIDYFQTMYKHNQLYIYIHTWASVRPAGPQPADSAASARRRKAASARRRCSKAAWKGLGDMMKETKVKESERKCES